MAVRIASTLSEHPLATHAVGECAGALLEAGGHAPDLVLLSVTPPLTGALEDILGATRALLAPGVEVAVTTDRILTAGREVTTTTALSMCALWVTDGLTLPTLQTPAGVPEPRVKAIRLSGRIDWEKPDDSELEQLRAATGTLILFGDPSLRSAAQILRSISEVAPSLRVVGGTTGSSRSPGATRLFLDGQMHTDGLIAALISPQVPTHATVTQGCTAFGAPMLATKAERNVMYELDGRSALEVVQELLATVALDSRPAARDALRIGVAQNNEPDHNPIHYFGVLGADKAARSIMVEDEVGLGATVQFALRDARSATEDLVAVLSTLPNAQACLAFTSGSRNLAYFGSPHHEASVISDALPAAAVWGLSCFDVFGSNTAGVQVLDQSASLLTFPAPERRDFDAI